MSSPIQSTMPQGQDAQFNPTLRPWLRRVWQDRSIILTGAQQNGREEGSWLVYDRYNDPAETAHTADFADFMRAMNTLWDDHDDVIESLTSQKRDIVPNTFYHFNCHNYDALQHLSTKRIYARTSGWQNSVQVARLVLAEMRATEGVQKFKIKGPGLSEDRCDSVVIWLTSELAVLHLLMVLKRQPGLYSGSVPPGVKQVIAGLGWAEEPPETGAGDQLTVLWNSRTHSYGSYLAGLIFFALEQTSKTGILDDQHGYREFLGRTLLYFGTANVSPTDCHRLRRRNELEHMRAVTNHRLVMHSSIAGDLMTYDYFRNPTRLF